SALLFFSLTGPAPPAIHTLSLHDALPIFDHVPPVGPEAGGDVVAVGQLGRAVDGDVVVVVHVDEAAETQVARQRRGLVAHALLRSEEHTSELQSRENLVCRLLLEKKKTTK